MHIRRFTIALVEIKRVNKSFMLHNCLEKHRFYFCVNHFVKILIYKYFEKFQVTQMFVIKLLQIIYFSQKIDENEKNK